MGSFFDWTRCHRTKAAFSSSASVSFMTAALVRSVCNKMGALRLKSIPGENVSDLCETILEMIKQIESSGKPPSDLLNLVSHPFRTCTQKTFRTFAKQVHTEIIAGKFQRDEMNVIHNVNNFCQALLQNNKHASQRCQEGPRHDNIAKNDC